MTTVQLGLSLTSPHRPVQDPSCLSEQHRRVLVALLHEGARGLSAEEAAQRCRIGDSHVANTRLYEMAAENRHRNLEKVPVPLTCRSVKRERKTAAGISAYVYWLSDVGREVASQLIGAAA